MLALCRYCDALKNHSYRYLPLSIPVKSIHRSQTLEVEYFEVLPKTMPILYGPDHDKPWVNTLRKIVHGRKSLFCNSMGIRDSNWDIIAQRPETPISMQGRRTTGCQHLYGGI